MWLRFLAYGYYTRANWSQDRQPENSNCHVPQQGLVANTHTDTHIVEYMATVAAVRGNVELIR